MITQLEMVGFRKLHSTIWACNKCDKIVPFPDVDTFLIHLRDKHKLNEVKIDASGEAWITEVVTEANN